MAKDVITRFKLETTGFDSKIKEAAKELSAYSKTATQAKEGFNQFTKANVDAAKALGTMATSTTNVKDRTKELVGAFNDAAKAYNALSDEQKRSDWAKALSGSLTQLQQRIKETKAEMQGLSNSMGDMSGGGMFSGLSSKMEGALAVFGGNLMTKAAGAVAQLGSEMADMMKQGIEMAKAGEGVRNAFERLGNGQILQGLREATHGTVTDLELMKAAVKFNDFKLPIEELGTMLAFAQQKAKDTGQSVDYMVDSIVTGLGRKSLMILDNLGLSATEIRERMKETGDMTKAVGSIIRDQMKNAGDYVETAADRAAQANVSLQNKMEELGRKFAPIEEASNQLWTSMKIGILDIIGGPLAKMLNQLTEAGRLRNQLNKMNGDPSTGQPTKVQQQLSTLRGSNYKNANYRGQLSRYDKQIGDLNFKIAAYGGKGKDAIEQGQVQQLKLQRDALKAMRSEYVQGAKDIMKPVETNIKTDKAEQNVKTLTAQLKELEKQRKKAVKSGDQEQVENLTKQISQVKTNLGILDPSAVKTTTGGKSKQQQAEDKVSEALQDYQQTIDKASLELKSGAATEADVKKKQLSAQERLYDAYGDAYALYKDPKYKDAQDKAAEEIVKLGGEVKAATEAQEAARKAARELESAQKKLADAQTELSNAQASGDLKQIYAAEKKVENAQTNLTNVQSGGTASPVAVPISLTTGNLEAFTSHIKEELAKADLGSSAALSLQEGLSDATAIGTILQTAIQSGIDTAQFDTSGLMQKLMNHEDISDEDIQAYVDQLNEKLKEKFDETEWPNVLITFDADTKKIVNAAKQQEKEAQEMAKDWRAAGSAIQAVGAAMNQIENPAAKVLGTIAQAVATMALSYSQAANSPAVTSTGWGWIAFAATGLATMLTSVNAIKQATAGFAGGGIYDGPSGFVPGNSFSGDNVMANSGTVGLNSGELILNRAQQGIIAQELEGGSYDGIQLEAVIGAEEIMLVTNNRGSRTQRGEYVQSNNRRG